MSQTGLCSTILPLLHCKCYTTFRYSGLHPPPTPTPFAPHHHGFVGDGDRSCVELVVPHPPCPPPPRICRGRRQKLCGAGCHKGQLLHCEADGHCWRCSALVSHRVSRRGEPWSVPCACPWHFSVFSWCWLGQDYILSLSWGFSVSGVTVAAIGHRSRELNPLGWAVPGRFSLSRVWKNNTPLSSLPCV